MRKLTLFLATAAALSLTACNTIGGIGKDVSAIGRAVTKTADEGKH
jgi:predicted small secreted protein